MITVSNSLVGMVKKLPDDLEYKIEERLVASLETVEAAELGKAERIEDAAGRYIEFCKSTIPSSTDFSGIKLVVDCANGATYHIAPSVFTELGAKVIPIGIKPDGLNINLDCGSTKPAALQAAVKHSGADLGIAFDGDGDRVIMVDQYGQVVDGDELLFIIARDRLRVGALSGAVVGTLMSNLGLELALNGMGIGFAPYSGGRSLYHGTLACGESYPGWRRIWTYYLSGQDHYR